MNNKNKIQPRQPEGLMPPQATDFEEVVLGAILLESNCLTILSDFLRPEMFYKDAHSKIYSAILSLHIKKAPVDMLTVMQELKKTGDLDFCGGAFFISSLTDRVSSSANSEYHARIIQQKYIQREVIRICNGIAKSAYNDDDVFETIDKLEKETTSLSKNFSTGSIQKLPSLMKQLRDHNEALLNKDGLIGVPSGYYDIDSLTGGWQNSDLIIVAARPAMAKTSLVCNMFRNAAVDFNKPGILFSLEMSALQLMRRFASMETGISSHDFTVKGIQVEQWLHVEKDCQKLINSPFFIDDTPGISLEIGRAHV
jgi:replicative DNA helicase